MYVQSKLECKYKQFNQGDNKMKKFKKNDIVKDNYGKIFTVLFQRNCQVFVDKCGTWFHPEKLYKK